ncbi:hypothetical protein AB0H51_28390 [Streptomyces griseoluteus]|uniref:hypothetical protein n=1 Tax=Streptomyces griseoluteus TaxID=29306 RepID=UPI0033F71319
MTTNADTTGTEAEKGELEGVFTGNAPANDDPWGFLKLPKPAAPAGPDPAATEPTTAAAAVESREPAEPPADAPKAERLAYFEGIVHRERELFKETVAAADRRFVERASGPLFAISRGLYRELVSDATGKPYTRFQDYLAERWGISRAHGYRILNEYPVMTALGDLAPEKLTTRQVPKLLGVLRSRGKDDPKAGAEAVRTVWRESPDKSPAALQATIDRLGWGDPEAEKLYDLSDGEKERLALVDRWAKAAKALDPAKARQLRDKDARRLLEQLKPFVEALEEVAQLPAGGKK